jgi:hypothetical protein
LEYASDYRNDLTGRLPEVVYFTEGIVVKDLEYAK